MEQGPQPFYERSGESNDKSPEQRSPEQLFPNSQESGPKFEGGIGGKTFEELVHEALEEELKFERDPDLRQKASQRADEILAEFAESKSKQNEVAESVAKEPTDNIPPELANQLGIKNDRSAKPVYPGRPGSSIGIVDYVMAVIIGILLIIVILLLIF